MDWLEILDGLSETAINTACHGYLREQPRRRPTPGDIYTRALACSMQGGPLDEGQRAAMPRDYEDNLETCLARARRWVTMGGSMAEHGHRFLAHWGASDR
ncbi:hypothetical protein [Roseicyclus amphidinii]|uniref:hypothetical protein n=1 Tax=Roseicyclus amphidinii TaxID=3034232 RepID=UPI0024E08825|nr:hypothetical protein [Roseicyclus sp. Amp-Y-6]